MTSSSTSSSSSLEARRLARQSRARPWLHASVLSSPRASPVVVPAVAPNGSVSDLALSDSASESSSLDSCETIVNHKLSIRGSRGDHVRSELECEAPKSAPQTSSVPPPRILKSCLKKAKRVVSGHGVEPEGAEMKAQEDEMLCDRQRAVSRIPAPSWSGFDMVSERRYRQHWRTPRVRFVKNVVTECIVIPRWDKELRVYCGHQQCLGPKSEMTCMRLYHSETVTPRIKFKPWLAEQLLSGNDYLLGLQRWYDGDKIEGGVDYPFTDHHPLYRPHQIFKRAYAEKFVRPPDLELDLDQLADDFDETMFF